jgi:hypothetical protein
MNDHNERNPLHAILMMALMEYWKDEKNEKNLMHSLMLGKTLNDWGIVEDVSRTLSKIAQEYENLGVLRVHEDGKTMLIFHAGMGEDPTAEEYAAIIRKAQSNIEMRKAAANAPRN